MVSFSRTEAQVFARAPAKGGATLIELGLSPCVQYDPDNLAHQRSLVAVIPYKAVKIGRLLSRLTPRQREIAGLLSEGYRQSEIARMLGITKQAVSRMLARVRARAVIKRKAPSR